jgi:hypothetical protein
MMIVGVKSMARAGAVAGGLVAKGFITMVLCDAEEAGKLFHSRSQSASLTLGTRGKTIAMPDSIVKEYVDAALAQLRGWDMMRWPGALPEAMQDPSIPPIDDWVGWKAIESTVTDSDLDSLEQELGLAFPPLYREFLQYRHFVGLTERGVRFERHLCHDWRERLRREYFHGWPRERIVDVGLIPFGSEAFMDAGSVCFDTRRRETGGDCPVVFWDHEWIGTENEIQPMFSSSRKMFECLAFVAATDIDCFHPAASYEEAQESLSTFLSIDPQGAGGEARRYWTGRT